MQNRLLQPNNARMPNPNHNVGNGNASSGDKSGGNIMDLNFRNSPNDEINQKAQHVQYQPPMQQNSEPKPRKKKRLKRNQLNMSEQSSNLSMSQGPSNGLGRFETHNQQPGQMPVGQQRPNLNIKQNQFQTGANNQPSMQMNQPQNNGPFSPGPRSNKGSGSKSRKRRPRKPKNKFMQPMNIGPNGQPMVQPNQFQTQSQLPQNIKSNLNQNRGPPNGISRPPPNQNMGQNAINNRASGIMEVEEITWL